jgi:hypothetical protein
MSRKQHRESVMFHRLAVAAALLCLTACASAQQINMPSFNNLRGKATESVDLTIGPIPIALGRWVMKGSNDPDAVAAQDLLKGVKKVYVKHYEFAEDNAYSKADLDEVRAQLNTKGWSALAQVRDNKKGEDVDVFIATENDEIRGITVVASEAREFTIVNVIGTLDMQTVAAFRDQMDRGGSFGMHGHHHHDDSRNGDSHDSDSGDKETAPGSESVAEKPIAQL